jgi:hypothetical protein
VAWPPPHRGGHQPPENMLPSAEQPLQGYNSARVRRGRQRRARDDAANVWLLTYETHLQVTYG